MKPEEAHRIERSVKDGRVGIGFDNGPTDADWVTAAFVNECRQGAAVHAFAGRRGPTLDSYDSGPHGTLADALGSLTSKARADGYPDVLFEAPPEVHGRTATIMADHLRLTEALLVSAAHYHATPED